MILKLSYSYSHLWQQNNSGINGMACHFQKICHNHKSGELCPVTSCWCSPKTLFPSHCCSNASFIKHSYLILIVHSFAEICFFESHAFQNVGYGPFSQIWSHILMLVFVLNVWGVTNKILVFEKTWDVREKSHTINQSRSLDCQADRMEGSCTSQRLGGANCWAIGIASCWLIDKLLWLPGPQISFSQLNTLSPSLWQLWCATGGW